MTQIKEADRLTAETAPSLRAILSERAPELLAALVEFYRERGGRDLGWQTQAIGTLCRKIKCAGLLSEPSQPAPLPAMWCGADAFNEGEQR